MNQTTKEYISATLKKLEALQRNTLQDLESFLNSYSKHVDNLIIETQESELVDFTAGKVKLKSIDGVNMQFYLDVYYQSKENKYINKKHNISIMEMDDYLTADAKNFLIKKGEITFDISKPSKENNNV